MEEFAVKAERFFSFGGKDFFSDLDVFLKGYGITMRSGFGEFFVWTGRSWKLSDREAVKILVDCGIKYYYPKSTPKELATRMYFHFDDCPGSIKNERIIISYTDKTVELNPETGNMDYSLEWDESLPIYYESNMRFGNFEYRKGWTEVVKKWGPDDWLDRLSRFVATSLTPAWITQFEYPRWLRLNLEDESASLFARWLTEAFPTIRIVGKREKVPLGSYGSYFADYPELPKSYMGERSLSLIIHDENPDIVPVFGEEEFRDPKLSPGVFLYLMKII